MSSAGSWAKLHERRASGAQGEIDPLDESGHGTHDLSLGAEAIECRVVAGGEFAVADLTVKVWNAVVAVETVTDEGAPPRIRNLTIRTVGVVRPA